MNSEDYELLIKALDTYSISLNKVATGYPELVTKIQLLRSKCVDYKNRVNVINNIKNIMNRYSISKSDL